MSVVLISRGTMTGVARLVERLKRRTGVRCVSREDLASRVDRHGRLARDVVDRLSKATREYDEFCELRRPYVTLMRTALLEIAAHDDVVYHGYSGHLLVGPIAHFIRVRITAPLAMRVEMTQARLGCTAEEADRYVRQDDEDRVRWARFMYGQDIRDPGLYDVCIDMRRLTLDTACNLISELLEDPDCQPTPESVRSVDELLLASRVEAALVSDARTSTVEASARASEGDVVLTGPYLEETQLDTVVEIARGVEGVRDVQYEYGYTPSFVV
ncbi:MAG TPA: cytidylate kinase family protein [Longimicrobiales bacterium]|nr:cytidylate kinase family protein [Longimicrobiales bacterium]